MQFISIDLETLGTNVDSAIVQIGACIYDTEEDKVVDTFNAVISYPENDHINVTSGTLKFWLHQMHINPEAVAKVFYSPATTSLLEAFNRLFEFVKSNNKAAERVYANGTKFDLGMLEYQFKQNGIVVPWAHNADRCMRTLRDIVGHIEFDAPNLVPHDALSDAIWQAMYITRALDSINQNGINI